MKLCRFFLCTIDTLVFFENYSSSLQCIIVCDSNGQLFRRRGAKCFTEADQRCLYVG